MHVCGCYHTGPYVARVDARVLMCETFVVETVHRNGIVQPPPVSPRQNTLPDSSPAIYGDDTKLKTIAGYQYSAALSEGTITDSRPGSAASHHTPSLDEGTILSSISSYRSIAERPPGLSHISLPLVKTILWP